MDITRIVAVMLVLGVRFLYAPGPINEYGTRENAQLYMPFDVDIQDGNDDQPGYDTKEEDYDAGYEDSENEKDDENPIR